LVDQLQDSLSNKTYRSHKLNLNTGLAITKKTNLSLTANVLKSFEKNDPAGKSLLAYNAFGTLQSPGWGMTFRVENGPFYYTEIRTEALTGYRNNRVQVSPYGEFKIFKSLLSGRLELNYLKDLQNETDNYLALLDLNLDLRKQGLSIRFYGSQDLTRKDAFNSMNVSIRKSLTLPLLGLQRYQDLKVVLFKDQNNNDVFDTGDEPIQNASILIGSQHFTTNKLGEARYKNINKGEYYVQLGQLNNIKGWITKADFQPLVKVDKSQELYVAFQKSKFLTGRLNLVKDPFSKLQFNPANIRITAIGSNGTNYTTLTDEQGNFLMNVPEDVYTVQINTAVFTVDFRVLQENFQADLKGKADETIVFEIREKRRQINIRKPGQ